MARGRRGVWVRLAALLALLFAGTVVALAADLPTAATLRDRIDDAGPVAPVAFVIIYALATLAPIPKNAMSVAAGVLFGLAPAVALVIMAATVGAVLAFWLGRLLGQDAVEQLTGTRVARLNQLLERRGLLAVIGVRLVPVVPFTAINYGAGLTQVRHRDYVIGTVVGIVPGSIAYVALGAYSSHPGSTPFLGAAAVLIGLSGIAVLLVRRRRRDTRDSGRRDV